MIGTGIDLTTFNPSTTVSLLRPFIFRRLGFVFPENFLLSSIDKVLE